MFGGECDAKSTIHIGRKADAFPLVRRLRTQAMIKADR